MRTILWYVLDNYINHTLCILVSQREVIRMCVANADSTRFIEAHLPKIYSGNWCWCLGDGVQGDN